MLAQTRRGAKGALLFHACVPVFQFGCPWPQDVLLQIHAMEADELFIAEGDLAAARDLVETTESAELFLYPGDHTCSPTTAFPPTTEAPRRCLSNA